MLLNIKFPNEDFNDAVREGDVGDKIEEIVKDAKPEAIYFTESDGQRAVVMVVDVADASRVPALAEPWFLNFDAEVEFRVAMTMEDLGRAGLDQLGEKWS